MFEQEEVVFQIKGVCKREMDFNRRDVFQGVH